METFENFIDWLDVYTESEKTDLKYCYAAGHIATEYYQIQAAAKAALEVACKRNMQQDTMFLSNVKNLNKMKYTRDDAARGIHVLRSVFAKQITDLRKRKAKTINEPYQDSGVVMFYDFLSRMDREMVEEEILRFDEAVSKCDSNVVTKTDLLKNLNLHRMLWRSSLREKVFEAMMVDHDDFDATEQYKNNTFVQRVHNRPGDGDVQKILHMDTYFDALKFWYFPSWVRDEHGPFTYASGSHLLTLARLQWMQNSYMKFYNGTIEPERTYGHAEGSLRVTPDELKEMKLEEHSVTVPGNTLVIANVFGFHRRGEATVDNIRSALHGSVRLYSPFCQ